MLNKAVVEILSDITDIASIERAYGLGDTPTELELAAIAPLVRRPPGSYQHGPRRKREKRNTSPEAILRASLLGVEVNTAHARARLAAKIAQATTCLQSHQSEGLLALQGAVSSLQHQTK